MKTTPSQKKLEIVILDFDDIKNPLLNAGQARSTYEVGSRLVKKGHKITVITSKFPNSFDRIEASIIYKHIGLGSRFIRLNNLFYIFVLSRTVRNLRADIIIECFTPPFSTLFSPLFSKIPVVALPTMFKANEFAKKYHLPFHWIEKFGMRFYKYFLPFSEVDCLKAKKLNPKLIYKIIPQGVDREFFSIPRAKPKHLLYFGRMDISQKGIDILLESFATVADKIKYPLLLAGHGPDESRVRSLIAKFKLEKDVKMIGQIRGETKAKIFSQALFNVFPSRHDEICLGTLEVLAAGIPIVCFDIPESSWISGKVALKAKPYDKNEFGLLILKACIPDLSNIMGQQARKFAQKYTWESVTDAYEAFCQKVVGLERNYD